ncbi:YslB family protein [Bacillus sp. 2205SS5-2]|uniref:YslB family protein n=1 Tax=Bacillus sp. 2205SS5-2 TaxID=3109031 RepID=UPI00300558EC
MKKTEEEDFQSTLVSAFSYELLRDTLIPDLLGKHTADLSYWAGKHLARKFPLATNEETVNFFQEANWGILTLMKEKKHRKTFTLSGQVVKKRLEMNNDACFKLEAGFLAQQYEQQHHVLTEAIESVQKRSSSVELTVQWDDTDFVKSDK